MVSKTSTPVGLLPDSCPSFRHYNANQAVLYRRKAKKVAKHVAQRSRRVAGAWQCRYKACIELDLGHSALAVETLRQGC